VLLIFTVSLCLPVLRYNRTTLWHALLFGIYGNWHMLCQPCHPYVGNLAGIYASIQYSSDVSDVAVYEDQM